MHENEFSELCINQVTIATRQGASGMYEHAWTDNSGDRDSHISTYCSAPDKKE